MDGGSIKVAPRAYRSRSRRPCDKCRKSKQLCLIDVEGQPCGGCTARKLHCTFDLPPLQRHRRQSSPIEETGAQGEQHSSATHVQPATVHSASNPDPAGTSSQSWINAGLSGSQAIDTGWTGFNGHMSAGSMSTYGQGGVSIQQPTASSSSSVGLGTSPLDVLGQSAGTEWYDPDIWQALFRPNAGIAELPAPDPISLDLEAGEGVESHFLGTGTFRGLTLREINTATQSIPNRPGQVEFRQVSADERYPVYFVRHPSLQYGQAPENGKAAWNHVTELCKGLGSNTLTQALTILKYTVLPALPIINYPQFEQACQGAEGSGPVPFAILAAAIAHSASYLPAVRPLHQPLWAHVINAIDAEFRQPRLMTLQLVMLLLSSRPGVNFAQSDITLSRAIGAVHVLGLHIDPSQWSLPRWERSLRIRLFWTILFHDKVRALLLGRPSHLHADNYSTPMPTIEDCRWDNEREPTILSANHAASLEVYIANCRLVPIIDKLLDRFMTLKAVTKPLSYLARIAVLHEIQRDIDDLESSLPQAVRRASQAERSMGYPTGVRSFQLCLLGLKVIVHRIELDIIDRSYPSHILATVYHSGLATAASTVELISSFTKTERSTFWMPYTFHHMSNAGSFLLRIVAEFRLVDIALSSRAISLCTTLCTTLSRYWREEQWDMADETLKRLAEPAFTVGKECKEAREVYRIISGALGYQIDPAWEDAPAFNYLGFINDGFDPSVWTMDGLSYTS